MAYKYEWDEIEIVVKEDYLKLKRKAKAFDEIREIEKTSDITGYHEDTQSYMNDVESIIEKYEEDE